MNATSWINVEAAFEFLLEELETELAHMERVGTRSLKVHEHAHAREFTDWAADVTAFRDEVRALRRKWQEEAGWIGEAEQKLGLAAEWRNHDRMHRELRTPASAFCEPILAAIHALGDSARTDELIREVPELMPAALQPADEEPLPCDENMPRWRNTLLWALRDMVADGWLPRDTPPDVWRATEGGQWRRECAALAHSGRPDDSASEVAAPIAQGGAP